MKTLLLLFFATTVALAQETNVITSNPPAAPASTTNPISLVIGDPTISFLTDTLAPMLIAVPQGLAVISITASANLPSDNGTVLWQGDVGTSDGKLHHFVLPAGHALIAYLKTTAAPKLDAQGPPTGQSLHMLTVQLDPLQADGTPTGWSGSISYQ